LSGLSISIGGLFHLANSGQIRTTITANEVVNSFSRSEITL